MDMDMDISIDIHVQSMDMDMDRTFHIHDKPGFRTTVTVYMLRESHYNFFCRTPESGGYGTPTPKSEWLRVPFVGLPPGSYAYGVNSSIQNTGYYSQARCDGSM